MDDPRVRSEPVADWHGKLRLEFANQRGTKLIHNHGQAPLKVQRSFYPEGDEICHSVIMHTAGGIVGGDRLTYHFCLAPNSKALITTPAASKIYRTNGKEAQQIFHIDLAPGACLEWLPQDTIVFNQAVYRQEMRINLAPDANWIGWEITRFGRSASGERFVQGHWRSRIEVWQDDRPLWIDRQWLPGSETVWSSAHGLADCAIVASLAWIGSAVDVELIEKARQLWTGAGEIGVTRLPLGLLCRYRGHSSTEARRWLIAVWNLIRLSYLQRPACIPRVWQHEQR